MKALEEIDWVGVVGRYGFRDRHEPNSGPGYIPALFVRWQNGKAGAGLAGRAPFSPS